jgi:uncharacterized iron-regulated protein
MHMVKRSFSLLILLFFILTAMKSDKDAFRFFDSEGKKADYQDLLQAAVKADIVLFGEQHNSSICHWLQLQLTKDLYAEIGDALVLGAEMFESDNQIILNEYLSGKIKASNFEQDARLWKNYKTDYKPLVDFAAENKLKFIATNIPRRYAALVNSKGFEGLDSLTAEAKNFIAPLPVKYDPELKGYKSMLEMGGDMAAHTSENLPKAQAVKDATMAHFILQNREKGKTFLHYNGTYHSDNFEGIVWYLLQEKPDLEIITISSVEQDTITELKKENLRLGSYILCIPADMTKTF